MIQPLHHTMKVLLVSIFLFMNANLAQGNDAIVANIDLSAPRKAFIHNWKKCVGSGHMLLGTRADWRAHLKLARDELGIEGIRGHGLFDDDMSVVPRLGQLPEFYNVDQVLDFLVELGLKPVVELSFMPKALAKCQESDQSGGKLPACGAVLGSASPPILTASHRGRCAFRIQNAPAPDRAHLLPVPYHTLQ